MPRKVVKKKARQIIRKPLKQDIKQTVKVVIGGDVSKKAPRKRATRTTKKKEAGGLKPLEASRGEVNALYSQPYPRFIVSNPTPPSQSPQISALEQDTIKKDLIGGVQGTLKTFLDNQLVDKNLNVKQKLLEDKRVEQKLLDFKDVPEIRNITAEVEAQAQRVLDLQDEIIDLKNEIKIIEDDKLKAQAELELKEKQEEEQKLKNKLRAQKAAQTRALNRLNRELIKEEEAKKEAKKKEEEEKKKVERPPPPDKKPPSIPETVVKADDFLKSLQIPPSKIPPSKIPTPVKREQPIPKQKVKAIPEDDEEEIEDVPLPPKKSKKEVKKVERGFKGDLEDKAFRAMLEEQGGMFKYGGRVNKKNKIFN